VNHLSSRRSLASDLITSIFSPIQQLSLEKFFWGAAREISLYVKMTVKKNKGYLRIYHGKTTLGKAIERSEGNQLHVGLQMSRRMTTTNTNLETSS